MTQEQTYTYDEVCKKTSNYLFMGIVLGVFATAFLCLITIPKIEYARGFSDGALAVTSGTHRYISVWINRMVLSTGMPSKSRMKSVEFVCPSPI